MLLGGSFCSWWFLGLLGDSLGFWVVFGGSVSFLLVLDVS